MKKTFILFAALVGVLVVLAVFYFLPAADFLKEKPKIAATIFPLFDIARNIVGDKIDVFLILPSGASPHTFEVTPKTALNLYGVEAILKIGVVDDWVDDIASKISPKAQIVEMIRLFDLRHFDDGSVDPHIWLDLEKDEIIAKEIADLASKIGPSNSDFFYKNLENYQKRLKEADFEIKNNLSGFRNKNIATFHDAWYYFANRYGLNVVASFESFAGKEPTPSYLAFFVETIKKYNLKAVFVEPQLSWQSIVQISKDNGVGVVVVDPIGGSSLEDDFIETMKNNSRLIADVLKLQQQ
jgi:zinc transport system substrate-binding protein